jgi:hypothetical protein
MKGTVSAAIVRGVGPGAMLATVLLTGCSSGLPPAPVSTALDIQQVEGAWKGEVQNGLTGRLGAIKFRLSPDKGMVRGDIVLSGSAMPKPCDRVQVPVKGEATNRIVLTVEADRAANSASKSQAEWASDPKQRCLLDTWFEGVFHADTLGGTYFSRLTGGDTLIMGEWWVVRIPLDAS